MPGSRRPVRRSAGPIPPSRQARSRPAGTRVAPPGPEDLARGRRGWPRASPRARSPSLPPPLPKALRRYLGQLPGLSPARKGAKREPGERALPAPGEPLGALVAAARSEHPGRLAHRRPLEAAPGRPLAYHSAPEVNQHRGNVDLHGADLVAGAAQARGPGQIRGLLEAAELRRQDRPDRARVDRLVGVAAGPR